MRNKNRKHTVDVILICFLMLSVAASTVFMNKNIIGAEDAPSEVGDFSYYKTVTISNGSNGIAFVSEDLTNFPIVIHDDTGDLLGKVKANGSDIAFFDSTKTNQFNHEIEYYNSVTGELWTHVNVTSISSTTDTTIYMYYGDSDGVYPVGHNPTSVWDYNYTMVQHMNDPDQQNDSTAFGNDTAVKGGTPDTLQEGEDIVGYAVNFDDTSSEYYNFSMGVSVYARVPVTVTVLFKPDDIDATHNVLSNGANGPYNGVAIRTMSTGVYSIGLRQTDIGDNLNVVKNWAFGTVDLANPTYLVMKWQGIGSTGYVNMNGTAEALENLDADSPGNNGDLHIGSAPAGIHTQSDFLDGIVDEIRISTLVRNDSWVNATWHSLNQSTGFITISGQEGEGSSFSLKGLTSSRITWEGDELTTVWCNSSGDGNEWLEINMSINATDNVTEIRIFMDDINNGGNYIDASNITLYVANATNATYYNFGAFSDGGSNISINQTTWNTYGASDNPFDGAGLTDKNTSLYCIFSLSIPDGATAGTYYSSAADSCKVYIGHT